MSICLQRCTEEGSRSPLHKHKAYPTKACLFLWQQNSNNGIKMHNVMVNKQIFNQERCKYTEPNSMSGN